MLKSGITQQKVALDLEVSRECVCQLQQTAGGRSSQLVLNVMDVVHTSSKLERRRLAARNQPNKGIQHFTRENKQMLEGYENLFYLLQTNPYL
ncbi:Ras GTPase-activating-like protein IQGAP1 [Oopsacas minuta]|uniref:Ras GTPase-activating-like protein IQGAP1 n=1 Tax=Oopsacas minuta TaxID=111878 RepID=A0AAV7KIM7_9METZ|nr:Ras GTPase-activating-like protein IQGAP1 [Oopsacas minuta]